MPMFRVEKQTLEHSGQRSTSRSTPFGPYLQHNETFVKATFSVSGKQRIREETCSPISLAGLSIDKRTKVQVWR